MKRKIHTGSFLGTAATFLLCAAIMTACSKDGDKIPPDPPEPEPGPVEREARDLFAASSFVATYGEDQVMDFTDRRNLRDDKKVGLFYFIWIGAHGYDTHVGNPGQIDPPSPSDINSPYDITEILKANPMDPQYGPVHAFHHWGKPYFDYYVSNDRWVIRKHAQLLSDAGIDVIFFDVTNAVAYLPVVNVICEEFAAIRKLGNSTPDVSFLLHSNPESVIKSVYENFYLGKPQFSELWFYWDEKPLILAPLGKDYGAASGFFTFRESWFSTKSAWFGDGMDKWPWGDPYPQNPGRSASSQKEMISVMPATHPTSNVGRSHNGISQPEAHNSGRGTYFKLQADQAMKTDPDFVFITGWNEWVAMRFTNGNASHMMGKPISAGDTYFVDLYNHEFSRDLEPVEGGFGDVYYYYMVDFIRRYKGVAPPEEVKAKHSITVDGNMTDWNGVESIYYDDIGDVTARDHHGYGYRIGQLTDNTGRNDILETRIATDGDNLYFYVETANDISPYTDPLWMRLFIDVKGIQGDKWEGFSYVVNNEVADATTTVLQKCTGGWNWQETARIKYAVSGKKMELAVPLSSLGIGSGSFTIDFKWIDNAVSSGDIQECMKHGDSAPNARFRYRFVFTG